MMLMINDYHFILIGEVATDADVEGAVVAGFGLHGHPHLLLRLHLLGHGDQLQLGHPPGVVSIV